VPTRCIVAGCNAASRLKSSQGCSFHSFPKDKGLRRLKVDHCSEESKERLERTKRELCVISYAPSTLEPAALKIVATESYQYKDRVGFLAAKRLKPDAVPTIFPKAIDRFEPTQNSSSRPRPAFQKCQHMSACKLL